MFTLMVVIFVLGYLAIALEHPLKVDKAASALIIGTLCWVVYIIGAEDILSMGFSSAWAKYTAAHPDAHGIHAIHEFIVDSEIIHHIGEIGEILFFLLGAMTIVEVVDQHEGFKVITDKIRTTNKVKLIWVVSFLTFFMSSVLDNLTTTIVMVALLRKLIEDKHTRWFFASMVVLAANAGGAWTPIGDVTTIMLWIGGQVSTIRIMEGVFLPSIACMVVPLAVLSFTMKGNVTRPVIEETGEEVTTPSERLLMLILGVSGLLFVPVFKTATHLPPYMGMLLSLGIIWVISEIMHRNKPLPVKKKLKVVAILRRVDVPTVLFFLGILSAVAALQSAGQLSLMSQYLDEKLHNIYLIDIAIGILSSVIDNVPLVAGAMGMYPIAEMGVDPYLNNFVQDGLFWEFLAYTAGTGGSILIIGSAAGVAAMGLEKIDFIWYLKKISGLALLGYLAGCAVYFVMFGL
ncbi:MAG: sodium:proton antiporter [Bacteroidetes bacterium GWF2_42_66]|nr:MAG: sodium:proton antiporter [Bacteroidetes bacterium GWA2_42_15]OFY03542.1 MAG: sodium:proton antiporter [Bacteroidetes bacterium GWE2_42_39]OFY45907.1 MAG: sodium:proton antiporter [Bacteroidetes bacterium GWF2_42_66]HBL75150.1 sodium:proton antiporter [Prolixibacteraceae bacterium]HCU59609.1 sodium:proton antiporter [Prolixibacteraceae bacterium]